MLRLRLRLRLLPLLAALVVLTLALTLAPRVESQERGDAPSLEEQFLAGDLDAADLARAPALGPRRAAGVGVLAQSWVSLVAFETTYSAGGSAYGGSIVVGVALDKVSQGRTRFFFRPSIADGSSSAALPVAPDPMPVARLVVDAPLARGAVRAAWRSSGIEVTDARIDDMIARSRLSAVLPETRLRVMQVLQDGNHSTSYLDEAGTVVDTSGATTTLEARLTWRLDRLLFAEDETRLERVRLERQDTRSRIATRVLELLFTWQRALLDAEGSDAGSRSELEATLKEYEAQVSLDVLTGGWFAAQPLVRANGVGSPSPPVRPPARSPGSPGSQEQPPAQAPAPRKSAP
jgi:hypothetical protein